MNILADASLPGLDCAFPKPFNLLKYTNEAQIAERLAGQDILLCRSTLKVNSDLLGTHRLAYVATASSGTDHLDHAFLRAQQTTIIDAKGCNAVSVADYVIATLAYLSTVKKYQPKSAGIIGMGKVGFQVSQRLKALGMSPCYYDPLKALHEADFTSCTKEELYKCDLLCIHAELHDKAPFPSRNLLDEHFLARLKPGCIIINAARGGIVNEVALLKKIPSLIYCTDVYTNEPAINQEMIQKATICTPHIAGHSQEAKFLAVALVSEQLYHLAGFKPPKYAQPERVEQPIWQDKHTWQGAVLSLYNPYNETQSLKQATEMKHAFINVRKAHHRHNFNTYNSLINNDVLHAIFGA